MFAKVATANFLGTIIWMDKLFKSIGIVPGKYKSFTRSNPYKKNNSLSILQNDAMVIYDVF